MGVSPVLDFLQVHCYLSVLIYISFFAVCHILVRLSVLVRFINLGVSHSSCSSCLSCYWVSDWLSVLVVLPLLYFLGFFLLFFWFIFRLVTIVRSLTSFTLFQPVTEFLVISFGCFTTIELSMNLIMFIGFNPLISLRQFPILRSLVSFGLFHFFKQFPSFWVIVSFGRLTRFGIDGFLAVICSALLISFGQLVIFESSVSFGGRWSFWSILFLLVA